ncbi:PREDICTED: bifunctional D-cysteine desulfhydrase/1-aminocyclopropane-1-carboxylate deaminase, mitochondrial-like isoform X1 [Branchiostoma belcheri]|uniref:Bifunctional D-cysteine desulfhydrase/1-aminocyclopropane-1-carboxylate deaminase, mitochondrial-like isoform X1 n=2 Tax=Branchiostoma belcheri TaxID=7741 RepID=A0A6P4Y7I4_BRABE|nr:PREDICTED: bifunctional D-cysteine desulfhydrase/1-aminocyclopropane-1-carboxylate deaminase, mitochondrial-like isoform X1 [Branchiostoma belcheri]
MRLCRQTGRLFLRAMSSATFPHSEALVPYAPPAWAAKLRGVPKYRLQLGQLNTPIQRWRLPDLPEGVEVFIKRDDMTGSTLSGNKVRKLEFLMADAIDRGCGAIITCGGVQSNHCRATAVAARQLGLDIHLMLRSDVQDFLPIANGVPDWSAKNPSEVGCEGNLLQDRLMGANVYLVQRTEWYEEKLLPRMQRLAQRIKETSGKESYLIPVGGSNQVGLFGYITAFQELIEQGVLERFDDLVLTVGSGGTTCGLCVANYLTGSKIRIHAVAICDDAAYFHRHINAALQEIGLTDVRSEDIVDIIEGYKGRGYALSTKKELEFVANVAHTSGIILDPVYTGKATMGMLNELRTNHSRFQGNRILFLHTGGIFGLYDGRMNTVLKDGMRHVTDRVHDWWNFDDDPPFP